MKYLCNGMTKDDHISHFTSISSDERPTQCEAIAINGNWQLLIVFVPNGNLKKKKEKKLNLIRLSSFSEKC